MNETTGGIHPFMIIGVIIYILPVIMNIFKITLPGFVTTIGLIFLIAGIIKMVYDSLKAR